MVFLAQRNCNSVLLFLPTAHSCENTHSVNQPYLRHVDTRTRQQNQQLHHRQRKTATNDIHWWAESPHHLWLPPNVWSAGTHVLCSGGECSCDTREFLFCGPVWYGAWKPCGHVTTSNAQPLCSNLLWTHCLARQYPLLLVTSTLTVSCSSLCGWIKEAVCALYWISPNFLLKNEESGNDTN